MLALGAGQVAVMGNGANDVAMFNAAALRIVELSQPFAPLPRTNDDPEILHVTRTWQFLPGGEMVDR